MMTFRKIFCLCALRYKIPIFLLFFLKSITDAHAIENVATDMALTLQFHLIQLRIRSAPRTVVNVPLLRTAEL
jgi:hypothetical protein